MQPCASCCWSCGYTNTANYHRNTLGASGCTTAERRATQSRRNQLGARYGAAGPVRRHRAGRVHFHDRLGAGTGLEPWPGPHLRIGLLDRGAAWLGVLSVRHGRSCHGSGATAQPRGLQRHPANDAVHSVRTGARCDLDCRCHRDGHPGTQYAAATGRSRCAGRRAGPFYGTNAIVSLRFGTPLRSVLPWAIPAVVASLVLVPLGAGLPA